MSCYKFPRRDELEERKKKTNNHNNEPTNQPKPEKNTHTKKLHMNKFLQVSLFLFLSEPHFYTIRGKPVAISAIRPARGKAPGEQDCCQHAPTCCCISIHMLLCLNFLPECQGLDQVCTGASAPSHTFSETTDLSLFSFLSWYGEVPVDTCTRETLSNAKFCQGRRMIELETNFYF